jgi:hypothetical protein
MTIIPQINLPQIPEHHTSHYSSTPSLTQSSVKLDSDLPKDDLPRHHQYAIQQSYIGVHPMSWSVPGLSDHRLQSKHTKVQSSHMSHWLLPVLRCL